MSRCRSLTFLELTGAALQSFGGALQVLHNRSWSLGRERFVVAPGAAGGSAPGEAKTPQDAAESPRRPEAGTRYDIRRSMRRTTFVMKLTKASAKARKSLLRRTSFRTDSPFRREESEDRLPGWSAPVRTSGGACTRVPLAHGLTPRASPGTLPAPEGASPSNRSCDVPFVVPNYLLAQNHCVACHRTLRLSPVLVAPSSGFHPPGHSVFVC